MARDGLRPLNLEGEDAPLAMAALLTNPLAMS